MNGTQSYASKHDKKKEKKSVAIIATEYFLDNKDYQKIINYSPCWR